MTALERGALLFNAGQFYEAHEVWEELWLTLEDLDKLFVQGLIQLAAAYHKAFVQVQPRGCVKLLESALEKLELAPENHMNVVTAPILRRARLNLEVSKRWRDSGGPPLSRGEIASIELIRALA